MSTYAQDSGLIVDAPKNAEQAHPDERWPLPAATLFIVSTSLALWAGIFLVMDLILG